MGRPTGFRSDLHLLIHSYPQTWSSSRAAAEQQQSIRAAAEHQSSSRAAAEHQSSSRASAEHQNSSRAASSGISGSNVMSITFCFIVIAALVNQCDSFSRTARYTVGSSARCSDGPTPPPTPPANTQAKTHGQQP
jgi:hypothetical protein